MHMLNLFQRVLSLPNFLFLSFILILILHQLPLRSLKHAVYTSSFTQNPIRRAVAGNEDVSSASYAALLASYPLSLLDSLWVSQ